MKSLVRSVASWVCSPSFFKAILVVFTIQAVIFAVLVSPSTTERHVDGSLQRGGGVVPDGNRHIGAIYYYADRPILAGPIVHDMDDRDLWLGDLERFPSYLYYYLLSFPVRIMVSLGASDWAVVLLVRLIGIIFGLVSLWALRRLALELKFGRAVANLSALALAVTGSFAWLTPAESYDVIGLMFWLLFLLASARLFMRKDARYIYWMLVWFFLLSITKYTYVPFSVIAGGVAFVLYARETSYKRLWVTIKRQIYSWRKELSVVRVAGLAVLLVVSGVLFTERIGGNLMFYRSFNPSCTQIHTFDACMKFGVFERNYLRAAEYDAQIESGQVEPVTYDPLTYTKFWLKRYFTSMYGYVGHIWIYEFWKPMYTGMYAFVAAIILLAAYLKMKGRKLLASAGEKYLFGVIVMLLLAQYLFNVRTFINFGGEMYAFAHQGRYLLSAIGLLYILFAAIAVRAVRLMTPETRKWVLPTLIGIAVLALATNAAMITFFVHATTPEWYSTLGQRLVEPFGIID